MPSGVRVATFYDLPGILQFTLAGLNTNTLSLTSSTFGYVTQTLGSGTGVNSTGGGRAVQLGARIVF